MNIHEHQAKELLKNFGVPVPEGFPAFSVEEAKAARETFLSSATSFVTPVVTIDDVTIYDGTPGPLSRGLQSWYMDYCTGLTKSA